MPTIVVNVPDEKVHKPDPMMAQMAKHLARMEQRMAHPAPVPPPRTDALVERLLAAQDRMLSGLMTVVQRAVNTSNNVGALETSLNKQWEAIQRALAALKPANGSHPSVTLPKAFYDRMDAIESAMTKTPTARMPSRLQASMDAMLDALRIANRRPVGMNR